MLGGSGVSRTTFRVVSESSGVEGRGLRGTGLKELQLVLGGFRGRGVRQAIILQSSCSSRSTWTGAETSNKPRSAIEDCGVY